MGQLLIFNEGEEKMHRQNVKRFFLLTLALLILSGCASSVMHKAEPISLGNRSDKALVTFMRPSHFGGAIQFGIWDSEKFIGVLSAGAYVQYLADPGEHVFLGRAENWSYVKANLEGGKQYFVLGKVFPGIWKARVALDPINVGDKEAANVDKWLSKLTPTSVIPEKFDNYEAERSAQVKAAAAQTDNGKIDYLVLNKEDGR
jgi:hypothetical protein